MGSIEASPNPIYNPTMPVAGTNWKLGDQVEAREVRNYSVRHGEMAVRSVQARVEVEGLGEHEATVRKDATLVCLLSSPQLGFFLHLLLRNPQTGTRKHTLHHAAETMKLLSGNPTMHDGRKPLSSFPETPVLDCKP
jgi:hypothetical protein